MTILHFTKDMVRRIVDEFPRCIECGDDHLASHPPTYFHKDFCMRGAGLEANELVKRMTERWFEIERRDESKRGRNSHPPSTSCRDCGAPATGTGWVAYHNKAVVLEAFPLCDAHSYFDDKDNRPHGFIPGVITDDTTEVQRRLREESDAKKPGFRSVVSLYKGIQ